MEDKVKYKISIAVKNTGQPITFELDSQYEQGKLMMIDEARDTLFKIIVKSVEESWKAGELSHKMRRLKQLKINEWKWILLITL